MEDLRTLIGRGTRLIAALWSGAILCAADPLAVTAVRYWSLADVTRIAVETNGPFSYEGQRLDKPPRVFYDLAGARHQVGSGKTHIVSVADGRVKQIRIAENQPSVTRVVVDLAHASLEVQTSRLSLPDRLMLEVREKQPGPNLTQSSTGVTHLGTSEEAGGQPALAHRNPAPGPTPPPAVTPASLFRFTGFRPPQPGPPPSLPAAPPLYYRKPMAQSLVVSQATPVLPPPGKTLARRIDARPPEPEPTVLDEEFSDPNPAVAAKSARTAVQAGDKASRPAEMTSKGDRSLTRVLGLKVRRVVIDPGHGGQDHGTTGPGGLTEKALVLDVAKRLGALVEQRLGSEVVYTRTTDTYVPLETRPQLANTRKADLFISIHANSSPARSAAGVETYYLSFTTSRSALEVAARENASSERSIHELQDVLQKIALKEKVDESREFAAKVQKSLSQVSTAPPSSRDRGVKRAPFVVLVGAQMPAVLVEIGFVSNSKEEQMMKKGEYRQKLAEALYKGLSQYAESLSHFEVAQRTPEGSE